MKIESHSGPNSENDYVYLMLFHMKPLLPEHPNFSRRIK